MEQDLENSILEDLIVSFDDSKLHRIRSSNKVPRSLSDFQIFVKNLLGDTISDVVINEVWKQIFHENSSLPSPEKYSDSQELTLNNSSKHDGNAGDLFSVFSKCNSRNVPNSNDKSHSDNQIFKNTKKSSCERSVIISDLNTSFSATQAPISNQRITLRSCATVSRPCFVEIKQSCTRKSNETNVPLEGDQTEEEDSSDCEIIEIVPLDNTGAINRSSGSEIVSNDGNKSDSDESVEILDSSENGVDKGVKRGCPIHGNRKHSQAPHSQDENYSKRKSMDIDAHSVESKDKESCEKSVKKGKHQKNSRRKREKYKMLQSQIKDLKSFIANELANIKCSKSTDSEERSRNLDNSSCRSFNNEKAESNQSFSSKQNRKTDSKSTNRVSSTEKFHASAFVDVNMSQKTTELLPEKKLSAKHTKNSKEQPPIVVELDSDAEGKEKRKKFLWRENILYVLRSKPGKWVLIEKVKRMVIARYYYLRGSVSENTSVKFMKYLHSTAGVIVDGDMAMYCNKPIVKVSSKSEGKQFELKTRKTPKEYKVS